MSALASISQLQLLDVWEDLLLAQMGLSSHGGDVCEVYIYRLMPYSPTVVSMPESDISKHAFLLANNVLLEICKMFESKHNVRINFFVNGEKGGMEMPITDLFEVYVEPERHRIHLRVVKNE